MRHRRPTTSRCFRSGGQGGGGRRVRGGPAALYTFACYLLLTVDSPLSLKIRTIIQLSFCKTAPTARVPYSAGLGELQAAINIIISTKYDI